MVTGAFGFQVPPIKTGMKSKRQFSHLPDTEKLIAELDQTGILAAAPGELWH